MLADPHSNPIPNDKNNYTEDEFQAALALLADDDAPDNKRKQPEYWSDSDNDDWPKYDHKNKYPYDPTAEIPAEKRNVINLQQTANKTNKQQPPLKRLRPSGNVPATNMQRLDYAIASRKKNKPRGWSLGGRKTKRRTKRRTKRKTKRNAKRNTKRKAKTRRYNKRGGVTEKKSKGVTKTNNSMINKYKPPPPVRISGNENDGSALYVQPTPRGKYIVEVENPNATTDYNFDHMAKLVGPDENAITPVYNHNSGLFN